MDQPLRIDRDRLLSWPFEDVVQRYTSKDAMLYALGVGLGMDPVDREQLPFVYEKDLRVLPTFPVVLCHPGAWNADPASGIVRNQVLHGEQGVTLHRPLPPQATLRGRTRIVDVIDKGEGRGALVYTERRIVDDSTGDPGATLTATSFCRANGGFGGPSGPVRQPPPIPERPADAVVHLPTLPQAALLYRLNADYNPLHADPDVAAKAGFPRPILHGLCTFGVAGHAILQAACGYDPARIASIETRFSAPLFPGETISVEVWRDGGVISFRAWVQARQVKVLDNGKVCLRAAQDEVSRR